MVDITSIVKYEPDELAALRRELVEKAEAASRARKAEAPEARLALREFLAEHPALWQHAGDLVKLAEKSLGKLIEKEPLVHESMMRGQEELRAELGYYTAPALERLLIEQVVLYRMRWSLAEFTLCNAVGTGGAEHTIDRLEQQAGVAQARYLRACESLARIRRLARRTPEVVQINLGMQQMNVTDGSSLTDCGLHD